MPVLKIDASIEVVEAIEAMLTHDKTALADVITSLQPSLSKGCIDNMLDNIEISYGD